MNSFFSALKNTVESSLGTDLGSISTSISQFAESAARDVKKASNSLFDLDAIKQSQEAVNESKKYNGVDLTSITPRIFIMGFPCMSDSKARMYSSNDAATMSSYLNKHHKEHYMIWNLADETYDYSLFNQNVITSNISTFPMSSLSLMFKLCSAISKWLEADKENVAIVHCSTGKGKSILVVATLLMWLHEFDHFQDSLKYVISKRARCGFCKDKDEVEKVKKTRVATFYSPVSASPDALLVPPTPKEFLLPSQLRYARYLSDFFAFVASQPVEGDASSVEVSSSSSSPSSSFLDDIFVKFMNAEFRVARVLLHGIPKVSSRTGSSGSAENASSGVASAQSDSVSAATPLQLPPGTLLHSAQAAAERAEAAFARAVVSAETAVQQALHSMQSSSSSVAGMGGDGAAGTITADAATRDGDRGNEDEEGMVPVLQIFDVNGTCLYDSTPSRSFVSSDENVVCFNLQTNDDAVSSSVIVKDDFLLRVRHSPEAGSGSSAETILRAALHTGAIAITPYIVDTSASSSDASFSPDVIVAGEDGSVVVRITKAKLDIASADPRVPEDATLELILAPPHAPTGNAADVSGQGSKTSVSSFPGSFQRDVLAWRGRGNAVGPGSDSADKNTPFRCTNEAFSIPSVSGPGIDSWILLGEACPYLPQDPAAPASGDVPAALLSLLPSLSLSKDESKTERTVDQPSQREQVLASKLAKLKAQALSSAGADATKGGGGVSSINGDKDLGSEGTDKDDVALLEREFEAASVSAVPGAVNPASATQEKKEENGKVLPSGKSTTEITLPSSPESHLGVQEKNDDDIDELEAYLASLDE
jgi:hypothetical protein